MMALIMGVRDQATLCRACDLGLAFQLTNIARDVVEDARAGRCYLPAEWLDEAGLAVSDLADGIKRESVFPLVSRLVDEAEPYYRSAAIGIRALPRRAAWSIATARAVYRDIGHAIVRRGPQALDDRVFTGKGRKTWRVVSTIPSALAPRRPQRRVIAGRTLDAAGNRLNPPAARNPGLFTIPALPYWGVSRPSAPEAYRLR